MNGPDDTIGVEDSTSETDELHRANRDLQEQVAALRRELENAHASERLLRESRWWRLGLALKNRRNLLFALRHPIWALKTLLGFVRRRGRARGRRSGPTATASTWLAGISPSPRDPADLWVAAIVSSGLRTMLEPDCHLITFRPDNWQVTLEGRRPHMLLVESTDGGNDGSWENRVGSVPHADSAGLQDLRELLGWCHANGTPTVFWFTAGADDAERYGEAASLFDHVVATEHDAARRLQRAPELRSRDVSVVPPGVQRDVYSPVGSTLAADTCALMPLGSGAEADALLAAAQATGLHIYAVRGEDVPGSLAPHVSFVDTRELERTLSRHAIYINTEGRGLPARVLAALASGAAVVSVPNATLEDALGSAVSFAGTFEEGKESIERLLAGPRDPKIGMRRVFEDQTIASRLAMLARTAGFEVDAGAPTRFTAVALASDVTHGEELARALSDVEGPSEVLVGVPGSMPLREADSNFAATRAVSVDPDASMSERWMALARMAAEPWVAVVGDASDLKRVGDLVVALYFAEADVIGSGERYEFVEAIDPTIAVVSRAVVASRGWPPERSWAREGVRMFTVPR